MYAYPLCSLSEGQTDANNTNSFPRTAPLSVIMITKASLSAHNCYIIYITNKLLSKPNTVDK